MGTILQFPQPASQQAANLTVAQLLTGSLMEYVEYFARAVITREQLLIGTHRAALAEAIVAGWVGWCVGASISERNTPKERETYAFASRCRKGDGVWLLAVSQARSQLAVLAAQPFAQQD